MRNEGIVLTRDPVVTEIWGYDFDGETRTVDVHIRTLRQKLGEKGRNHSDSTRSRVSHRRKRMSIKKKIQQKHDCDFDGNSCACLCDPFRLSFIIGI